MPFRVRDYESNVFSFDSGAFDDLNTLADLARREDMWLHVDGAFGAWVKISRTHRHLVDGMELADSLAVDLHKWMDMPCGIGCTLAGDRLAHYSTFVYSHEARYLKSAFGQLEDELVNPHNLVLALSRSFSSPKAYMLLRPCGREKYARLAEQNLDQTNHLAALIAKVPDLEITAPVASNIVCFRYRPVGLAEPELEALDRRIYEEINRRSVWIVSDTTIKGTYMLRACNVNHRTRREDLEFLVKEVREIGSAAYASRKR